MSTTQTLSSASPVVVPAVLLRRPLRESSAPAQPDRQGVRRRSYQVFSGALLIGLLAGIAAGLAGSGRSPQSASLRPALGAPAANSAVTSKPSGMQTDELSRLKIRNRRLEAL